MSTANRRAWSKPPANRRRFRHVWDEVAYVFDKLAYWLYERARPTVARKYADRLRSLLKSVPDSSYPCVGALGWALIAELDGSVKDAIAYRERLIEEIHIVLKRNPIARHSVRRRALLPYYSHMLYGRLAEFYEQRGQRDKAIEVLRRSKRFCQEQGIRFESRRLLTTLQRSQ